MKILSAVYGPVKLETTVEVLTNPKASKAKRVTETVVLKGPRRKHAEILGDVKDHFDKPEGIVIESLVGVEF